MVVYAGGTITSTTPTLRVFSRALSADPWTEATAPFFGDALAVRRAELASV